jgi:hypothetical protein
MIMYSGLENTKQEVAIIYLKALSRHLPGRIEQNHRKSKDSSHAGSPADI